MFQAALQLKTLSRTCRKTQTVLKKKLAQEYNQAWESLSFTEDYQSIAKQVVHTQLIVYWVVPEFRIYVSLFADNEEIKCAVRSNFRQPKKKTFSEHSELQNGSFEKNSFLHQSVFSVWSIHLSIRTLVLL